MRDAQISEEALSREAAQRAARAAAEDIKRQRKGATGLFALYTWGALAFVSAIFAVSAVFYQGSAVPLDAIVKFERPANDQSPSDIAPEAVAKIESTAIVDSENAALPLDQTVTGSIDRSVKPELKPLDDSEDIVTETKPAEPIIELGVSIGGSDTGPVLAQRYAALKRRAPDLFSTILPRILRSTNAGISENRLVAGPFTSPGDVATFCRAIKLRLTMECSQAPYEGEPVAAHGN